MAARPPKRPQRWGIGTIAVSVERCGAWRKATRNCSEPFNDWNESLPIPDPGLTPSPDPKTPMKARSLSGTGCLTYRIFSFRGAHEKRRRITKAREHERRWPFRVLDISWSTSPWFGMRAVRRASLCSATPYTAGQLDCPARGAGPTGFSVSEAHTRRDGGSRNHESTKGDGRFVFWAFRGRPRRGLGCARCGVPRFARRRPTRIAKRCPARGE